MDIANYILAQHLMNAQLDTRWKELFDAFLLEVFPTKAQTLGEHLTCYWTVWQSEGLRISWD